MNESASIAPPAPASSDAMVRVARKAMFLKWLRKAHGWIGLWGAFLGLMFGITGFLQNHRAILKIDTPAPQVSQVVLPMPAGGAQNPQELAAYLQRELRIDTPPRRVQREPARPVAWGDASLRQPEHWTLMFRTPAYSVMADYWAGSDHVSVRRSDFGILATLEGLHKGEGVGVGWVLVVDSLAGALILLCITGVILWTGLNRRRSVGAIIFSASVIAAVAMAVHTV
jgi:hypothetical protein